jgi:tetratricopeptide (TPR) repeat protein
MKYSFLIIIFFFSSCSVFKVFQRDKTKNTDDEESSIAYNFAFTEATKQKLFGNYSQALALLFKCVEVKPNSSAAYYLISEIYLKNDQKEKALDYCRLAVKSDPSNNWYRLDLADLFKLNNKVDSSILQYKIIVKRNPNNFRYRYNLAALYFENGDLWKSLRIIRKLFDDDKKNEELAITKFQIERKLKKYRGAEHTLKKIFKRLPTDYKYLGLLAEHYKSIGKLSKGEKTYKELLRKDSLNEIGVVGLATFYIEAKRIREAQNIIQNKLIADSELSEIEIQFLINTFKVSGFSQEFKSKIVGIIKNWFVNNIDNDIDLKNLTDVFVSAGLIKDISELLEYLYNNKESFKHFDIYLMVLNLQDRNDEILKVTSDSIGSGEATDYLYYYNGIGYYKKKQYKEACDAFQKGLSFLEEERTYEEQLLTLLGESYYKMNDIEKSFEYFEKVLEINAYNLYVLNNYSYYLALLDTSLDKAEEMSKKCILMDKHNFNYLDTHAWVLVKRGKYLEAYDFLKRALELGGKLDPNVVNHYQELLKIMNLKS